MALSTAPKSILESTVAAAKASHLVQIADALTDAQNLERTANELFCVPSQHLEAFRQLERALTMRFKAAQLSERAQLTADSNNDTPSGHDTAALQEQCQKTAESIIVRYNEVAVRAFKRGDFDLASHLLSNAFRLADASDETADAFFGNNNLKHSVKATTLNNFGCLERRRGRLPVALQYMRHALEFASTQSPATLLNISAVQTQMGQIDEAIGSARRALGLLEDASQTAPGTFRTSQNDVLALRAVAYHNLAMALERRDLKACVEAYNKALALARSASANQTAAQIERGLARVLALRGNAVDPPSPRKVNPDAVAAVPSPPLTPEDAATRDLDVAIQKEALDQLRASHPVDVSYSAKKPFGAPPIITNQRRVDPAVDKAVKAFESEAAATASSSSSSKPRVVVSKPPAPPTSDQSGASPRPKIVTATGGSLPEIAKSNSSVDLSKKGAESNAMAAPSHPSSSNVTSLPPISVSQAASQPEATPTKDNGSNQGARNESAAKPPSTPLHRNGTTSNAAVAYAPQPPSNGPAATVGGARTTRLAREEEENRKEEAVQMMHQRLVALLKIEDDVEHEYLAARRIQCLARSFLSRKRHAEAKLRRKQGAREAVARERREAQVLVRFFKEIKQRRDEDRARKAKERAEEKLRVNMTIIIQCAARKFFARRYVRMLKRKKQSADQAARVLQRALSTFLSHVKRDRMLKARAEGTRLMLYHERRAYAATRIQAVFRRHHREVLNLVMKGDLKAARDKGWHLSRSAAAKRIQKVVRGRQVRQKYRVILRERAIVRKNRQQRLARLGATLLLQATFRGQAIRNQLKPLFRLHLQQRRLLRAQNRGGAATTIQCLFRCFRARQELKRRRALRYQEKAAQKQAGVLHLSARQYQRGLALM